MQDRPTAPELLEAVRRFLAEDVVPSLEGTRKFHARVAANVMAILAREWELEEGQLEEEWSRLAALLGTRAARPTARADLRRDVRVLTESLCRRIRDGEADAGEWRDVVLSHVRQTVRDKLAIANPSFASPGQGPP